MILAIFLVFVLHVYPTAASYREYLLPEERPEVVPTPTPEPVEIGDIDPMEIMPSGSMGGGLRPKTVPWRSHNQLDTGWCDRIDGYGWGGLSWPVDNVHIRPGRGFSAKHKGIDIDAAVGTEVRAMTGGVVVWAGYNTYGFGNLVVLAHGSGYQTYYAHLTDVYVSCHQYVSRGYLIGTSGQTGLSTWPALHIEVRQGDLAFDPEIWLP
jgi:murein DD-endopeptidase MepM/ murein hydrolase activator NlpD